MADRKLPELRSRLRLDTSDLDSAQGRIGRFLAVTNDPKAMAGYQASLERVGATADRVGSKLTRNLTLPVVAAGAVSVKMASDFNTAFTKMTNLAGVAGGEVAGLKDEVTDLAKETAQSPTELAGALYQIRSSGLDGADALDALDASAKAAAIGMGSATDIADALTSAVNAYGKENLTATDAANTLVTAVKLGKGEASEFAPQLGRLLPLAQNLGVGFDELAGALSYMTLVGGDTAQASTQLQGILQKLLRPSQLGAKALEDVGLSTEKLREVVADKGIVAALQLVNDKLGGNQEALAAVFEDSQAVVGVLQLLRGGGKEAAGVIDEVTQSNESLAESFARLQGTDEFKAQQAITELQVAAIELGQKLIPIVTDLADGIIALVDAFDKLPQPVQTGLVGLIGFAAVAGPVAKALGLATKGVSGLLKVASSPALDNFRLGLMGITQSGAGAANVIGGLLSSIGPGPVAVAAGGLAVLAAVFIDIQSQAKEAEARVDSILSALESGQSPTEAIGTQLANTLAGTDGGFAGLQETIYSMQELIDQAGISASDILEAVLGSDGDFTALQDIINSTDMRDQEKIVLLDNLNLIRTAAQDSTAKFQDRQSALEEMGIAEDGAAGSTSDLTDEFGYQTDAAQSSAEALQEQVDAARAIFDANQAVIDSEDRVRQAREDLAAAQATVNGTSDEYLRAQQAITDAEEALADAQQNSREAQEGLTDARKEAKENLEDLALAASGAVADEASAAAALARAKSDLLKAKTPLDRQEAQAAILQAEQALAEARDKTGDSADALTEAEQKGIENSDAVVAAKERITDAADAEREAQERVGEASKAAAKLQADAAEKVTDANRKLIDAQLDHVEALADVAEANGDVSGANDILLFGLESLKNTLDPNSPLRKNLQGYIDDLAEAAGLGGTPGDGWIPTFDWGSGSSGGNGTTLGGQHSPPEDLNVGPGGRSLPRPNAVRPPEAAPSPFQSPFHAEINQHFQVLGNPDAETLRQMKSIAKDAASEALRKVAVGT